MNRFCYLVVASLFAAACSSGGSGTPGSGTGGASSSGTGGSGTGGSNPSGTGGATNTGSGGAMTGTGGAPATGTGGSGAGGSVTDGGTDAGGTGGAAVPAGLSFLERNGDIGKTGHAVRPMLTKAKAMTMTADAGFNATFTGAVWSSPLYMEKGPNNKGAFFVATASNSVYALDETTGAVIWTYNSLGAARNTPACGCCDYGIPQGMYGTPVIDEASRTLFAVGALGNGFAAVGLNIDTGMPRTGWPVTIPGNAQTNQRTALALVKGILYVAFGGHQGDCGDYHGSVTGINIATPAMRGTWTAAGSQSGIWGAGGLASDGDGVFALTGNGSGANGGHGDSEEVIRITGLGTANKTNANVYYPSRWQAMDGGDLDMGCNAAAVFDVPGLTTKQLVAPAKDGHLYFLDAANLGGMAGEKFDLVVATEGMSTRTSPTAYTTTKGMFVAISTDASHCPAGAGATGNVIMGVQVAVTAGAVAPKIVWCAARSGDLTAPISTTSDAAGSDAIVWFASTSGGIKGVDGETGTAIVSGSGCSVRRWSGPIVGGAARIVVAADGKLCSWSAK
ncbi:MAG TPA: hypothetical protein VGL59_19695 [Polyangia bacterium]